MTSLDYEKNRLLDTKVQFCRNVHKHYYKFNIIRRFSSLLRFINCKKTLDLGPYFMDKAFKDSNIIKLEFTDDLNDHQRAINECNLNVKNQIKEIVNKLALISFKSEAKSISREEEQNLDSAIAMVKELASQSMVDFELQPLDTTGLPIKLKKPKSTKKRFSFNKFKYGAKVPERKSFTEQTKNIADIQSIFTDEAREAYDCLIGRRKTRDASTGEVVPTQNHLYQINSSALSLAWSSSSSSTYLSALPPIETIKSSTTITSTNSVQIKLNAKQPSQSRLVIQNEVPLPPRSRSTQQPALKQHQRKHPLIIPCHEKTT